VKADDHMNMQGNVFLLCHDLSSMSLVPAFILRECGRGALSLFPDEEASSSRKRKGAYLVCLSPNAPIGIERFVISAFFTI
jgi:hypothetical protein